jgi:hypothetical protein
MEQVERVLTDLGYELPERCKLGWVRLAKPKGILRNTEK